KRNTDNLKMKSRLPKILRLNSSSTFVNWRSWRSLRFALPLALGLTGGSAAWSAPSIQSIDVSPSPLLTGQTFTIAVTASADVTQAVAKVSFRPAQPSVQIPLVKQGEVWTGTGAAPMSVPVVLPGTAGAMVMVAAFDTAHRRAEAVLQVGLKPST